MPKTFSPPINDPCQHPDGDGRMGIYTNPDTKALYANARKGDEGIPFTRLLPEGTTATWEDFPVTEYLNYAYFWLATPKQWDTHRAGAKRLLKNQSHGQRIDIVLPPIDLAAYGLINTDNTLDYENLSALFQVVATFWDQKPRLKPSLAVIYSFHQQGFNPAQIQDHILRLNSQQSEIDWRTVTQAPEVKIIQAIQRSYNAYHKLPEAHIERTAATTWRKWTRSLSSKHSGYNDPIMIRADLRSLRIVNDQYTKLNLSQVSALADFIWQQPKNTLASFDTLLSFVKQQPSIEKPERVAIPQNTTPCRQAHTSQSNKRFAQHKKTKRLRKQTRKASKKGRKR